jgi:uncharacterized protein (TIGR02145 family)
MKKFCTLSSQLLIAFLILVSPSLQSQSPLGIPYQAVMRNADGTVMASNAVELTFMIHEGAANGNVVYQESHSLTSNAQGLVSCVVGSGVVSQGNFASINWGGGAKFLHVIMGTIDLGTQQMLSVPYALHSASADNATNATNATNAINATNAETAANGFSNVSQTGDTLYMANGNFIIVPGISAANYPAPVLGCTNAQACNYNASATEDDGSCLYQNATCDDGDANTMNDVIDANCQCSGILMVNGCTNAQACNYNPAANVDDGSCLIQGASCNDGNANTTNDVINANCECAGSATGNGVFVPGNGVTDIDGTVYTSIVINGQEWMQQNLAVTKYRNGDPIPTGLDNTTWQNTTAGAYAIYNNDAANNTIYGKLYNWYAVNDSRGLCPTGWHVPSDGEWTTLETSLGGSSVAGGNMKSTTGWNAPNTGATNESGFSGLPGGDRRTSGAYSDIGNYGYWWSSTEFDSVYVWARRLDCFTSVLVRYGINDGKRYGFSVRCVRD